MKINDIKMAAKYGTWEDFIKYFDKEDLPEEILFLAFYNENREEGFKMFKTILEARKIDLNYCHNKSSIMHIICNYPYYEFLEEILKYDVDINIRNKYGNIPLHNAASNFKNEDRSINLEKIKILLDAGSDVDNVNKFGKTLFDYKDIYGEEFYNLVYSYSKKSGKNKAKKREVIVNLNKETKINNIFEAAERGSFEKFLEYFNKDNIPNDILIYALNNLNKKEGLKIFKFLLETNKINLDYLINDKKPIIYYIIVRKEYKFYDEIIKYDFDVNWRNYLGNTLLLFAILNFVNKDKSVKYEKIKILLDKGADVDYKNSFGLNYIMVLKRDMEIFSEDKNSIYYKNAIKLYELLLPYSKQKD
ncbi:ankyrin repeat domain-containing protein [Oceanivirga salmonicida]|nr:ankyrin repeat domain-containing protein [Oceanivirga salmonicida]